jgi:DNA-binding transcriptional MerR regulator
MHVLRRVTLCTVNQSLNGGRKAVLEVKQVNSLPYIDVLIPEWYHMENFEKIDSNGMVNGKKTYYSISEVCSQTGLEPHVLRYWETEFSQLRPKKNRAGNRAYREKDIELIAHIKNLLYEQQFTIPGAKKKLSGLRTPDPEQKKPEQLLAPSPGGMPENGTLVTVKKELGEILALLSS